MPHPSTRTADHHPSRHRRGDVLRAVMETADVRRDGVLPMDVPGVAETFADEFALATALQMRWHTRLAGHVERALSQGPADLETAVLTAWRRTADDLAGVRAVLDACAADPSTPALGEALERARRKDWILLAAMAGRASVDDGRNSRALAVGRSLEEQARAAYDPRTAPRHRADQTRPSGGSLLDRLRAHLAA